MNPELGRGRVGGFWGAVKIGIEDKSIGKVCQFI